MHIHGALLDVDMVTPDLVKQLATAVNPLRMPHQVLQQLEFGRADFEWLLLPAHAVGIGVQTQQPDIDHPPRLFRRAPTQHGPDAGQQFARRKGLDDVVIGTRIQPGDAVRLIAAGRDHEDRHLLGSRVTAPTSGQTQATLPGQHPVQQNDIGQHLIEFFLSRQRIHHPHRLKTVVPQVHRHQLGNRRLVFNDQNPRLVFHLTADSMSAMAVWRTSAPLTT